MTKDEADGGKSRRKTASSLVSSSWGVSQLKEGREKQKVTNVYAGAQLHRDPPVGESAHHGMSDGRESRKETPRDL